MRSSNTAQTFTPYDPNDTIGNTSPTAAKPPKKNKCGAFGQILIAIIAVVVTIYTAGAATSALAAAGWTTTTAAGTIAASTAASVVGGAIGGAVGSIVSQAVGVATGIQDKFSWNAVALSAIGAGVGAGLGGASNFAEAALKGAAGNAITQGIGVATGLQKEFSWASVAAAGLGAGVGFSVGKSLGATSLLQDQSARNIAANMAAGGARLMANAAARTLIDGTDFGDNVLAALPDVIGQTIGNAIAGRISGPSASFASGKTKLSASTITDKSATFKGVDASVVGLPQIGERSPPPIDGVLEGSPGYSALKPVQTAGERLEVAIPEAIAQIERAALNPTLPPTELADLQASINTLRSGDVEYRVEAIQNQSTAAGGARMQNGSGIIIINPSAHMLFYSDGSVNVEVLARILVHEGRHVYDNQVYSLQNGPSNIDEVRRTERNAYRTQAAYQRAVGMVTYTQLRAFPLCFLARPLTLQLNGL
ncbi:MAG: hypothetical protein AB7O04_01520 [Hyphomonadaceae bacterium]